jgi:hypothetical protein
MQNHGGILLRRSFVTTGSNNIEMGSAGGSNDESVIRLGSQGTRTSIIAAPYGGQLFASKIRDVGNEEGRGVSVLEHG